MRGCFYSTVKKNCENSLGNIRQNRAEDLIEIYGHTLQPIKNILIYNNNMYIILISRALKTLLNGEKIKSCLAFSKCPVYS